MTDDTLTRVRAALARLAEVEREATPGPWFVRDTARIVHGHTVIDLDSDLDIACDSLGISGLDADAAAIVALRNAAPALLALAEAAVAHVARAAEKHGITSPDDCYEPTMADLWRAVAALADAPGEVQP